MELFDLVDINDKIIGTTDKLTAHANGDIHRIVAVFLFDENGNLYLQEHLISGNILDHSVGGHVDRGESYDVAAKRESEEELGLDTPLSQVSVFYSDETWGGSKIKHFVGLYECQAPKNWVFKENDEVKHIYPMKLEEIVEKMNTNPKDFTGGFKNTMYEYIKRKNLSLKLKNYNLGRKD
jgi:isopentenyl-diphosphate Delta-isomerase